MKLTAESTVINDSKLNTNIDNAQTTADDAITVATSAQGTAQTALDRANGSVVTDTLHYLATSQGSGVTINTPGWTTTPQTITSENKYLWTYHTYTKADGTFTNSYPVITGTYGENGTSVTILGSYDTLADLQREHPTGNLGDAYLVAGDLYVWNGTNWEDVGQIQGPEGPQGPQGDTGVGISAVQPQYYLSTSPTTATGGTWSTELIYTTGKYIWTRERVLYTNGNISYSTEIYNNALTTACETAEAALRIASDTAQYFWFTSTGTDTGAHISNKTQADFISNPTGGNLLARSNGIAVRDGMTEMATFSGTQARIGKTSSSNVTITDSSITMSDGVRPIYTVNTPTTVTILRTYNATFPDFGTWRDDKIIIGRSVSAWVSAKLTYRVNSGSPVTLDYGSLPIYYGDGDECWFTASLSGNTISVNYGKGNGVGASDTVTIISFELEYTTTQPLVESTIGAYANTTTSAPFRIGNGTSASSKSNAALIDWAGTAMFGGDVFALCGSGSSGGRSLITPLSLGEHYVELSEAVYSYTAYRLGRVVMLQVKMEKDTSTAGGANFIDVNIAAPKPIGGFATSGAFYGTYSIGLMVYTSGSNVKLRVRNATNRSMDGMADELWGTITYITTD